MTNKNKRRFILWHPQDDTSTSEGAVEVLHTLLQERKYFFDQILRFRNELLSIKAIEWQSSKIDQTTKKINLGYPNYPKVVIEFIESASQGFWADKEYLENSKQAGFLDSEYINNANFSRIKTMITYIVRGERFGDGHWATFIEDGTINKILKRIDEINSKLGI
jgi:hypothetical protein